MHTQREVEPLVPNTLTHDEVNFLHSLAQKVLVLNSSGSRKQVQKDKSINSISLRETIKKAKSDDTPIYLAIVCSAGFEDVLQERTKTKTKTKTQKE